MKQIYKLKLKTYGSIDNSNTNSEHVVSTSESWDWLGLVHPLHMSRQ